MEDLEDHCTMFNVSDITCGDDLVRASRGAIVYSSAAVSLYACIPTTASSAPPPPFLASGELSTFSSHVPLFSREGGLSLTRLRIFVCSFLLFLRSSYHARLLVVWPGLLMLFVPASDENTLPNANAQRTHQSIYLAMRLNIPIQLQNSMELNDQT